MPAVNQSTAGVFYSSGLGGAGTGCSKEMEHTTKEMEHIIREME